MLKNFLACILFSPTLAMANLEQSLVGKWECKGLENEYLRHTSDIEYRDDGIFTEHSVMHNWAVDDDFYQIDSFSTSYKYRVMGDKVVYYDGVVQSYTVDMPNLDESVYYLGERDELINSIVVMKRSEVEQMISEDMISRIRFLDKDTYITAFESIDEDFPTDIENNHCKRKI
ncbi:MULTISPECIES: hypothetical protein [Moraxella]|uniref:Lipocalin-like domain-containing protein n=1 Tax=Moraxella lacunata TaxID=477 RepID=A0A1B8PVZ2_MORLA|nr:MULTISPECIES: hypothetical protein [Moraxella]MBE9579096.1 hypothetical protein [Moraxella sp. K1664]MBE9587394.1 hypothetical protein [Moraxella sp. K1630]MBE9596780.1 hypothetical protein [Moraxella sp. K2450]MDH9219199.1 hypothetical protein [Moraxella lacunata]MDI4483253.1 hypothetical protein [Moraxella lacunata]